MLWCIDSILLIERDDHLAVGMCLEVVWSFERLSNDSVVVDLAVDGQSDCVIVVDKRLGT